MIRFLLLTALIVVSNCCNKKPSINNDTYKTNYLKYKSKFDSNIINQFPLKIDSKKYDLISNGNLDKNDVGLFLIEYDVADNVISELEKKYIRETKKIYSNKEDCLLKVNRFETIETKQNMEVVDSVFHDMNCVYDKYPIPNFIDYNIPNKSDFWKDETFSIYVLESKNGVKFKKFEMLPNKQMPIHWSNGYSKGYAIDKLKKTVIYWTIIW